MEKAVQKIRFICGNCETQGTVRLGDDYDDAEIGFCPCCGDPLPSDGDDSHDDDE
jgi:hypothetical protein